MPGQSVSRIQLFATPWTSPPGSFVHGTAYGNLNFLLLCACPGMTENIDLMLQINFNE